MRNSILIIVFVAMALLAAGCISSAPAQEQPGGESSYGNGVVVPPVNPPSENGAANNGGSGQPGGETQNDDLAGRCTLRLDTNSIEAGRSVAVDVTASPGRGQGAAYDCGNQLKSMGKDGFFTQFSLCKYDAPGQYTVGVYIDGRECASELLTVTSQASPPQAQMSCKVLSEGMKIDNANQLYEAKVEYYGVDDNERLIWDCGPRKYYLELGSQPFGGVNAGTVTVNCEYREEIAISNKPPRIEVSIGDYICGYIPTS